MREQPDGAALLAIAREVLKNELLPLLPKDSHYKVLMIANAMGIAARQLQAGDGPQAGEQAALSALLDREGSLPELSREFAQQIRNGAADGNQAAQQLLWRITEQRVRESAPKALRQLSVSPMDAPAALR